MSIWTKLYNEALKVQKHKIVSPFIEVGQVSATLITKSGNIYTGVCIDTSCSLGMCAERNAIANMITHGESQIDKIVTLMPNGKIGMPCGACREFMMQLDKDSGDIEILLDLETTKTIKLKELAPNWWGENQFKEIQDSIDRINKMTIIYDEIRDIYKHDPTLLTNNKNYQSLKEYLENGTWLKDYEMEEKGLLPTNINKAILAQDSLYNLICEIEE